MPTWATRAVEWLERLMLLTGIACLTTVHMTWKHLFFQELHARAALRQLVTAANRAPPFPRVDAREPPAPGSFVGILDIPAIEMSVAVLEGDYDRLRAFTAGHVRGTPLPWQEGNSALAGHRDTVFRSLQELHVGHRLVLVTRHGTFDYRVTAVRVVEPHDVWVLDPPYAHLTLITCFPFRYVGPAPRRFVVHARRLPPEPV